MVETCAFYNLKIRKLLKIWELEKNEQSKHLAEAEGIPSRAQEVGESKQKKRG